MDTYRIVFNPEKENVGVYGISLVDDPANETLFVAMSKTKEIKLATASEEKRLLVGPVLIPNQKIYRDWFEGCEIFFDAETIRLASQEFFKNGYQKNSTIDHEGEFIQEVTFVESWIIEDSQKDKSALHGFDLPVGTWMVAMKVDSDEIWNDYVKEGKVKGFSIDSFFDIEKVDLSKINNKQKQIKTNMGKNIIARLISLVSDAEKELEMLEIEVPTLGVLKAEDFSLGYVVTYEFEGQWLPLADGEFVYEGKKFETDEVGTIKEISDEVTEDEVVVEAPVVELSEVVPLWEYKTADDKKVYASWLGLGEVVTDENSALLISTSFEVEGVVYGTDENGSIVTASKNADSPFWRKENTEVVVEEAPVAEVTVDEPVSELDMIKASLAKVMKALNLETVEEVKDMVVDRADELEDVAEEAKDALTLEDAMAKIDELMAVINTMKGEVDAVKAENVELSKSPAATRLSATPINKNQVTGSKAERRAALLNNLK